MTRIRRQTGEGSRLLEAAALRIAELDAQLADKDADIERTKIAMLQANEMMNALLADKDTEIARLTNEVEVLRYYGNKDCTAMADATIAETKP
jgi:hypothetical protein